MNNKISSFMGGLIIAIAIALFTPTAAQATWSNHNTNTSTTSTQCDTYKSYAKQYLKAYYRCYNYTYYRYYCYYMKKYKQCQSTISTTPDCNKYKTLAARYLAAYYRCGNYCYYKYYCYYSNLYKKCEASLNKTGKVCGQVFEDTNSNGDYESSDTRLANVTVKITDAKGKVHTVTTNSHGYYCASNIAVGTASVDIDESTLSDNATQVVGTDPTNINVKANCKNWEERNGYTFPIPTGKVCGTVYEDINNNKKQDDNETGVIAIAINIIDANGDEHKATTDATGKYCLDNVPEGSASITVDTKTLPTDATLTAGENPNDITVVANQENDALTDGYTLPTPVGKVCGYVIVDGKGQKNVTVNLMDSEGNSHSAVTNNDGKYCFEDIPQGEATVDVDNATLPDDAELTEGEDPSDVDVVANTENDAGKDVYTLPIPVGNICGQIVVDGNGQESVTLNITDVNGDVHTTTTGTDGKWCSNGLPAGDAIVDIDETTLPAGVKRVLGEDQDTYEVVAGDNADAGIDGYVTIPTGKVCGVVFEDVDKDGVKNVGEIGIPNITVTATDANGNSNTAETDVDGKYCIEGVQAGEATVTVDEADSDMPTGAEYTGWPADNPTTVTVTVKTDNDAGTDGFYNPNTELGSIHGTIFCDSNNNGIYDDTDTRLDNITVTVTDAEGNVYVTETAASAGHSIGKGTYHLAVKPGEAKIVIDINDPDLPTECNMAGIGYNPDFTDVIAGQISHAGGYGFIKKINTP